MQQEPEKLTNITTKPCKNCGSQMVFDAKRQQMHCNNCGSDDAIVTATDKVVEHAFTEALNLANVATGLDIATKAFACKNCGAVTQVEATQVALTCSFCTSTNVNEEAFAQRQIRPFGIMPFQVVSKEATEKFKEWIGKGWFHPSDLSKLAKLNKLEGIYIPFWTFDAQTNSNWTAEAGYYYYETETYTDSNGNTQTRQVQYTRWEPASGNFDYWFDDVTIVASGGIKQHNVEKIYPYDLTKVVNYESQFILGWKSEVYAVEPQEGFQKAEEVMDNYIHSQVVKQIPGDTYRSLNIQTHKTELTYKHLLLPLWLSAYLYNKKLYQVLVNGQTGKIGGEKPISALKVTLAVLVVLIVAITIYYLTR